MLSYQTAQPNVQQPENQLQCKRPQMTKLSMTKNTRLIYELLHDFEILTRHSTLLVFTNHLNLNVFMYCKRRNFEKSQRKIEAKRVKCKFISKMYN